MITFDPRLPDGRPSLIFRVTIRGTRLRVDLEYIRITFTVEDGGSAAVVVRGQDVLVDESGPVTVALVGQGPAADRCTAAPD
ncbi:glycosyl hydrolase family 65 protein [Microlunatus sp. GCM10028923]|uniref:glycosyl hydrolase family 65 protein n=1 Tax=Microlunatus sp. GCM10028923 TaxID=3273400 RepID=UPI003606B5CE